MNVDSLGIEGIPLITRFKTKMYYFINSTFKCIEGIPLITRFKTFKVALLKEHTEARY